MALKWLDALFEQLELSVKLTDGSGSRCCVQAFASVSRLPNPGETLRAKFHVASHAFFPELSKCTKYLLVKIPDFSACAKLRL
jgi:hypothetical protein